MQITPDILFMGPRGGGRRMPPPPPHGHRPPPPPPGPRPPRHRHRHRRHGCYVATAVYGSYDCPQVWTLRRYRDEVLARTWYGRAFIRTYYAVSPTLVRLFGGTSLFRRFWQARLDRAVEELNRRGFASTPYSDREW